MIKDNFYPDDVTDTTTGITFSAFTENISGIADSMADAYLMGYLPPEMVAPSFRPVILSGGGDSVSAVFDNSQNYGWGFIFRQGSADGTGGVNYVDQNGVYRRLYNLDPDYRFINAAEMAKYCTDNTVTISIAAIAINKDYWDSNKMATTQLLGGYDVQLIVNVQQMYTFAQWRDIIKNDTIFYNNTVQGHTITLRPSDFGDSNDPDALHVKFFESGNYIIRADIYNYVIGATHYMNLNAGYSNYIITPFVQTKISAAGLPDTVADVIPGTNLQHFLWMRYTNGSLSFERGQTTGANNYDYIPDYNITFGGFNNGTVSVSDIDFSTASNTARLGFVRNWYFNYDNGVFRIVPTFTPLDIYHHMMLFHKHTLAPSDNYSAADTVTVFTSDDAPTMDTVSGNLSDIANRLRPWQIPGIDVTANTFTPEDIPSPTPEPTDDQETGDSIIRPGSIVVGSTAGFLTQYVLNAANVAELGAALWSGIGDSNFWQNVLWTTLTASASFDVSSLLQYFISLRVYPFPLVNVSTYAGTGDNKIRIGRGAVPLTLGSSPNVGTISQYADILDAGSVQVPAYYGDFRDYAQTDVILHAPYIGTVNLAAADVIGATLHLVYAIDFAAGSCTAYLDISRGGFTYPVCLGSGVIGADVPLTADSASRRAAALFGLGDAALSNIGQNASAERGAEGELDLEVNPYGMLAGAARGILGANPIAPTMSGIGKGFDSFAGAQTAYIQIRRAITKNPGNQEKTYGRQTARSARLGDLSGFTVCQNVDVSGLDCDLEIKNQIKRLLETGVYI